MATAILHMMKMVEGSFVECATYIVAGRFARAIATFRSIPRKMDEVHDYERRRGVPQQDVGC